MAEVIATTAGVAAALLQAKTAIWDPLKQTIESSNDIDGMYRTLDGAMKMLVATSIDKKDIVESSKTTMTPTKAYTDWNDRVNLITNEVDDLKTRYTNETKRSKWFSFYSRSSFTKKMKKAAYQVYFLLLEVTLNGEVVVVKKPACVVEIVTSKITNIPTLQHPLKKILGWLDDKNGIGIRIHGLAGSGKTTIMENLNNHVKVAKIFDIVIWVTVSKDESRENRSIDEIQKVLLERLKLNIKATQSDPDLISSRIREELKDIKYLLLLDDINKDINLSKVGIPISDNGSKIVFTTRSQHSWSSITTRHINVEGLKPEEALEMFRTELNRPHLEENHNIKKLMPHIVNWCGDHPLMIKVAAGVFRVKETEQSWHDGLRNLSKWPDKGDNDMQEIYRLLKCCFDCLKDTHKTCFFYSAMYPEDSDINKDSLLYNWAAEELLDRTDDVEETLVNGREILDDLMKVSLLMENASQQCIRMHKLIRLAAIFTLRTHEDKKIKFGESLKNPLDMKDWKDKIWISLVDSKMDALPVEPDCPMLSTLFLQKNPNLQAIPQEFFKHMCNLRALDLYGTNIKSLPCSLLKLVNLKVLYLHNCVALVKLPDDFGNLQELEVLDIRGSGLASIPHQVKSLICLRRLLVSISNSVNDDIDVIAMIPMLKELVIDVANELLESEIYGLIVHVVRLTSLSLLQFCSPGKVVDLVKAIGGSWKISFPTEALFESYIGKVDSSELQKCQFFVGCDISSRSPVMDFKPYFKFDGVSNTAILQVFKNDVAIELLNHNELEHLSSITAANLNKIRSCVIEGCKKMRTIVDGNTGYGSILKKLEQLHMINLPVLENIVEGPMQGLTSLKTLILCNCPTLTSVCTYGVILQLPEIRHLEVKGCSQITKIFNESLNVVSPILPNLKTLILVNMPQLTSVMVSNSFEWPSLERLKILECRELKRFPFKKGSALNLKLIEVEKSWWEALEIDENVKEHFGRYCT